MVERIKMINEGTTPEIEYMLSRSESWVGEWKMTKRWNRQDDRDIAEVRACPISTITCRARIRRTTFADRS